MVSMDVQSVQELFVLFMRDVSFLFVLILGSLLGFLAALLGLKFGMFFLVTQVLGFMHSGMGTSVFRALGAPGWWATFDANESRKRMRFD